MNLNDVFTPCIPYHSITLRFISGLYQLSQGIAIYAVTVSKAKNFCITLLTTHVREAVALRCSVKKVNFAKFSRTPFL